MSMATGCTCVMWFIYYLFILCLFVASWMLFPNSTMIHSWVCRMISLSLLSSEILVPLLSTVPSWKDEAAGFHINDNVTWNAWQLIVIELCPENIYKVKIFILNEIPWRAERGNKKKLFSWVTCGPVFTFKIYFCKCPLQTSNQPLSAICLGEQPEALVTPPRTKNWVSPWILMAKTLLGCSEREDRNKENMDKRQRQWDRGVQVNIDHIEATHHSFLLSILSPSLPNKMAHRRAAP